MKVLNALTVGIMIALGGCATSGPTNDFEPRKEDLVRLQTMPTTSAIKEAEGYINRSREKDLDFLTPQHFSLANKALSEAKDLLAKNQPPKDIVQKVAVAEAVLKNSERVARKIRSSLSDELTIKSSLDDLNAPEIYRGEYGSLVSRLNEIIRQVEEGKKADSIKERQRLIKEMTQLEVKSIKYNALNEPKEILKRVKYRGGPELAPITYKEALEVYASAEKFISENPHMREAVEKLAEEALFAAKRALYIAEEVAALSHKVKLSLEQIVLDEEYRLYRVARALTNKDVRNHPLEVQSELLADAVEEIASQQRKQEDLVVALRDTLIKVRDASAPSALNGKIKKLKKEKNEWLAKDALYAAKMSQLQAEIEAKESQLVLLNNQLQQTKSALSMSEMENQALSMTIQEDKKPIAVDAAKPETALASEAATANKPINEANTDQALISESSLESTPLEAETAETANASPAEQNESQLVTESKPVETVVDKSTSAIIADLLAEESQPAIPEQVAESAVIDAGKQETPKNTKKLDPTKALAAEN